MWGFTWTEWAKILIGAAIGFVLFWATMFLFAAMSTPLNY